MHAGGRMNLVPIHFAETFARRRILVQGAHR
jgi:hypothetical protein